MEDKGKANAKPAKKEEKVEVEEVKEEVKEEKPAKAKKAEVKEEKTEEVDYSKKTVAELKEIAAEKGISTSGMKKADIIDALTK